MYTRGRADHPELSSSRECLDSNWNCSFTGRTSILVKSLCGLMEASRQAIGIQRCLEHLLKGSINIHGAAGHLWHFISASQSQAVSCSASIVDVCNLTLPRQTFFLSGRPRYERNTKHKVRVLETFRCGRTQRIHSRT